jgi:hypothetical protein
MEKQKKKKKWSSVISLFHLKFIGNFVIDTNYFFKGSYYYYYYIIIIIILIFQSKMTEIRDLSKRSITQANVPVFDLKYWNTYKKALLNVELKRANLSVDLEVDCWIAQRKPKDDKAKTNEG